VQTAISGSITLKRASSIETGPSGPETAIQITPRTAHIGAEIREVDLAHLDNETFAAIREAHLEWKVQVFRDQRLSCEEHKAFGRRFGASHVYPMHKERSAEPEVLTVKTTADSAYTAGDGWHTDFTCDELPQMGFLLHVKEVSPFGGDTVFADT
jgi:taurine dioxygenase